MKRTLIFFLLVLMSGTTLAQTKNEKKAAQREYLQSRSDEAIHACAAFLAQWDITTSDLESKWMPDGKDSFQVGFKEPGHNLPNVICWVTCKQGRSCSVKYARDASNAYHGTPGSIR